MDSEKNNSQSKEALAALFIKRLPGKVQLLEQLYQQLVQEKWPEALLNHLKRQVQQLSGLAHASELKEIEYKITAFLATLNINTIGNYTHAEAEFKLLLDNLKSILKDRPHQIYLCIKNDSLISEITEQLKFFGSYCHIFNTIEKLFTIHNTPDPDLILLDAELCEETNASQLKKLSEKTPLIFFSIYNDVKTRLFCLRSGGKAFFTYPFEFSTLIEKIDLLISGDNTAIPYSVLIVDDSKTQASVTKQNLESAGIITKILADPLEINTVLLDYQPDVILMDLYMPDCSGSELARIIRQQENFVSIPIVFLSAESDTKKQLDALSLGGDDFLTKPVQKEHLISAVKARAARSRALKAEMVQDSLTGLLNHTRILEQLELEMARSDRDDAHLSFVMIDIDHFKLVNDKYGHPIGDRVIKNLARLLKKRLRKTDSVGRYGGEEFAVILPKTEASMAQSILTEIRESFEKIQHQSHNEEEFTCTFSAGIAQMNTTNKTVDALCQAADKALYAAKHGGRNCVILESNI